MMASIATQTFRAGRAGLLGSCVGVLLVWRTGLLSAAPSAIGLTMLAASDHATRRIPRNTIVRTAWWTAVGALVDAARLSAWDRLATASVLAVLVGLVAAAIWLVSSGIAFGDVKLLALAAFVPAWLRSSAIVTMVAVALMAAACVVVFKGIRSGSIAATSTIAFGPPLLVGWLVGVLTA